MNVNIELEPDPRLLGRLDREVKNKKFSLIEVMAIKTAAQAKGHVTERRTKVSEKGSTALLLVSIADDALPEQVGLNK